MKRTYKKSKKKNIKNKYKKKKRTYNEMIRENKIEENHTKIKAKPILKTNENNFQ